MCISCQPLQWLYPWHTSMTSPPVLSKPSLWVVCDQLYFFGCTEGKGKENQNIATGNWGSKFAALIQTFLLNGSKNVKIQKYISCLTRIDHSLSRVQCTFSIKKLRIFRNLLCSIDQFSVFVLFPGSLNTRLLLVHTILASGSLLVCRVHVTLLV